MAAASSKKFSTSSSGSMKSGLSENPLKLRLSPGQKRALRNTWKQLKEGSNGLPVMERIFEKLIVEKPVVKDVFYKAAFLGMFTRAEDGQKEIITVRAHGKLLGKMFDDLILSLDARSNENFLAIRELGAKHAFLKKGFSISYVTVTLLTWMTRFARKSP